MDDIRWRKSSRSFANNNCVEVGDGPWRKASYSGGNGGGCVEVLAAPWRTASYSGNNGGGCVDVSYADDPATIAAVEHKADEPVLFFVRDSKNPGGPKLAFTAAEWEAFIAGVKNGEFDITEDGRLVELV